MNHSVTVPLMSMGNLGNPMMVGDKVKLARNSKFMYPQRIKNKEAVYRLLKRKFVPYFVVTDIFPVQAYQFSFNIKPLNF